MHSDKQYYAQLPFEIKDNIDDQTSEMRELFTAKSQVNARIGFNMLKITEEESYKALGYKTVKEYVEDKYKKAYSTVSKIVKNCRRYKELELDPKKIEYISLSNFEQITKLLDKNLITEEELKKLRGKRKQIDMPVEKYKQMLKNSGVRDGALYGMVKAHGIQQETHQELRGMIDQFAMKAYNTGLSVMQAQSQFNHIFNISIEEAYTLKTKDAKKLIEKVCKNL